MNNNSRVQIVSQLRGKKSKPAWECPQNGGAAASGKSCTHARNLQWVLCMTVAVNWFIITFFISQI